jgi:hypothetical protein
MITNKNKQIWMKNHVPVGQTAAKYTGKIWVSLSNKDLVTLNISVRVLPFTLEPATLDMGFSIEIFKIEHRYQIGF